MPVSSQPLPWPPPGSGAVAPRRPESSRGHGLSEKPHEPSHARAYTHVCQVCRLYLPVSLPCVPQSCCFFLSQGPLNPLFLPSASPGSDSRLRAPPYTLLPLCCLLPTVLGLPVPGHGACLQMLCPGEKCPASESELARILPQDARELWLWASELTEPTGTISSGSGAPDGSARPFLRLPQEKEGDGTRRSSIFWRSLLSRSFRPHVC